MLLLDGQVHHDTHAIPMGNYVIGVGNYVIATPSKLGNYMSADMHEFLIDGRDLSVSVFPGISVLAGSASALAALADLRATVFVGSLSGAEAELRAGGWTIEGPLGGGASLLARDPDGNLLEFVENSGARGDPRRTCRRR